MGLGKKVFLSLFFCSMIGAAVCAQTGGSPLIIDASGTIDLKVKTRIDDRTGRPFFEKVTPDVKKMVDDSQNLWKAFSERNQKVETMFFQKYPIVAEEKNLNPSLQERSEKRFLLRKTRRNSVS